MEERTKTSAVLLKHIKRIQKELKTIPQVSQSRHRVLSAYNELERLRGRDDRMCGRSLNTRFAGGVKK